MIKLYATVSSLAMPVAQIPITTPRKTSSDVFFPCGVGWKTHSYGREVCRAKAMSNKNHQHLRMTSLGECKGTDLPAPLYRPGVLKLDDSRVMFAGGQSKMQ